MPEQIPGQVDIVIGKSFLKLYSTPFFNFKIYLQVFSFFPIFSAFIKIKCA